MNNHSKTLRLTRLALLAAIVLVLAYTPLGYIHIGPLAITPIMIPVTVGAILLGPTEGAILGGIFGLTSFSTCFGSDAFGTTLMTINPVFTFLTCVPTRVLAGWLPAVIFKALYRKEQPLRANAAFGAAALAGGAVLLPHRLPPELCDRPGRGEPPGVRAAVRGRAGRGGSCRGLCGVRHSEPGGLPCAAPQLNLFIAKERAGPQKGRLAFCFFAAVSHRGPAAVPPRL